MPHGKPAGVPCAHLTETLRCAIWGQPERPAVCSAFQASPEFCGSNGAEALALLTWLESETRTEEAG